MNPERSTTSTAGGGAAAGGPAGSSGHAGSQGQGFATNDPGATIREVSVGSSSATTIPVKVDAGATVHWVSGPPC